jgi:hypothetical protein
MPPSNLTTDYPDDALMYHPVPPVQTVELPLDDGRVHLTVTGLACMDGDEARGPDSGTVPRNEYGEGTESYGIAIADIGPRLNELEQIAVFISTGAGMIRMPGTQHGQPYGGQFVNDIRPAFVNGRLGVFFRTAIVGMGSVDSVQFQITCIGTPAADDASGEDAGGDDAAGNQSAQTATGTATSPDASDPNDDPFKKPPTRDDDPFGRDRNDVFSDDDFGR